MQVSEIKSDIDFMCGSTSASYPNSDKMRNVNIEYQRIATLIWQSDGQWQFDDSNSTTLPVAKTSLVSNQQDYSLPSSALRVQRVQIKDNGGNWSVLKPIDVGDFNLATETQFPTPGLPTNYDLIGSSLILYPTPFSGSVTLSAGLEVFVQRSITELGVSATSATPGFPAPFHRLLSYAASIDFVQDVNQKQSLLIMKDRLEKGLVKFYSHRADEFPTRIIPHAAKNWRQNL